MRLQILHARLFSNPFGVRIREFVPGLAVLVAMSGPILAEDKENTTQPGHSVHAQAFNEGPRQAAYLMPGMGNVHWQTSTDSPLAQRFFDQGLSQLHGFWYFEAERSFRQAAAMEPERAIHYWGMARANVENTERSSGFIDQAMRRIEKTNKLERRLIEAWSRRVKDWPKTPEANSQASNNTGDNKQPAKKDPNEEVQIGRAHV